MKKAFIGLLMAISAVAMVLPEAEARRMGGGSSFGKQSSRSIPAQRQNAQQAQPAQNANAARQQQNAAPNSAAQRPSMMRNILGGALLGLGLGALLSHLGIGGALASIISTLLTFALIAVVVMFLYRMFVRRNGNNSMQPAYSAPQAKSSTPEIGSGLNQDARPAAFQGAAAGAVAGEADVVDNGVPADFDTAGFLRNAKTYFIRLQAAWDRADVNDIREFTTPEMFAELRMQLQERGESANHTDVMHLDAELVGIETLNNEYLASVRFDGMIREEEGASTQPFAEVWNLSKPVSGGGWTLAGIQQVS